MTQRLFVSGVLCILMGCGGSQGATRPSPPPADNSIEVAEPDTPRATATAPTLGAEILSPDESELESLLPALSRDGRIAVVETETDTYSGTTFRRGVIIRASQQSNWVLAELDEGGESRVDPATSAAHQADFLSQFEGRAFRPLVSTCSAGATCTLGTQRGELELTETHEGQLVARADGRELVSWHLPELELPRTCCAGGPEDVPECFVRVNRWDVWAAGSKLLVRTAVESATANCSSTASYEILDVDW
ncbi:MAG: hypothetical protein AB8H86_14225 [Polyangiales bacterium]